MPTTICIYYIIIKPLPFFIVECLIIGTYYYITIELLLYFTFYLYYSIIIKFLSSQYTLIKQFSSPNLNFFIEDFYYLPIIFSFYFTSITYQAIKVTIFLIILVKVIQIYSFILIQINLQNNLVKHFELHQQSNHHPWFHF